MKLGPKALKAARNSFGHDVCGYIYADGIAIRHDTKVRVAGQQVAVSVWYARPGTVKMSANYGHEAPDRIVCHNVKSLLDGIKSVQVYFGNCSQRMEQMGQTCDTVTVTTDASAEHQSDIFSFFSSPYTVQHGKPDSLAAAMELSERDNEPVIWEGGEHGPEKSNSSSVH